MQSTGKRLVRQSLRPCGKRTRCEGCSKLLSRRQLEERRRSLAMQSVGTAQQQQQVHAQAQRQMMVSPRGLNLWIELTTQQRVPVIMSNGQPITMEQYEQIQQQQHHLQQQQLIAQGYPSHMLPQYNSASAQAQAAMHAHSVAQHAQAQQQVAIQQQQQQQQHAHAQAQAQAQPNGSYRSETPRNMSLGHSGVQDNGSPSTESGGSMKRGIGGSPVDAPTKKARVGGKRPSECPCTECLNKH